MAPRKKNPPVKSSVNRVVVVSVILVIFIVTIIFVVKFSGIAAGKATSALCTDSDGGISFDKQGTVLLKDGTKYTDRCLSNRKLEENSCDQRGRRAITANGCTCSKGVCIIGLSSEDLAYSSPPADQPVEGSALVTQAGTATDPKK